MSKTVMCPTCSGVRGIKSFTCRKCGAQGNNYSNGVEYCNHCIETMNICVICGEGGSNQMTALEAVNRLDFLRAYGSALEDVIYEDNFRDDVMEHFKKQREDVRQEIKDIELKLSKATI